jgi:hypothetical protein
MQFFWFCYDTLNKETEHVARIGKQYVISSLYVLREVHKMNG